MHMSKPTLYSWNMHSSGHVFSPEIDAPQREEKRSPSNAHTFNFAAAAIASPTAKPFAPAHPVVSFVSLMT